MHNENIAIHITRAGGPDVLQARAGPVPVPGDDEVLIEVRASGVNRHDCNQRRRGPTPAHSDVPGLEVAGVVVGLGSKVDHRVVGEAVCALTDGGGYGQFVVAKSAQVLPIPLGLDWVSAAALPEAAFTIWHNFFRIAALQPLESVLLHGGTSGVGTLAIQVLTVLGHPVFATCGSSSKVEAAVGLGALQAFDYHDPAWVGRVLEATADRGVDVILDMSGGQHASLDVNALAWRGRLVHLSAGDGASLCVPLRTLMAKELKITGSLLRPLPDPEKAIIARALLEKVWPLVSAGRVRPIVHQVLPFAEAVRAHRLMEEGRHVGKLILDVSLGDVGSAPRNIDVPAGGHR